MFFLFLFKCFFYNFLLKISFFNCKKIISYNFYIYKKMSENELKLNNINNLNNNYLTEIPKNNKQKLYKADSVPPAFLTFFFGLQVNFFYNYFNIKKFKNFCF